jgi:glutathione S-transferase
MSSDEMVLINYTSIGEAGYGGMFALAGGFKATITARLGGVDLTVKGFALGEGKLYEWGLAMRRLADDEVPHGVYTYKKDPAFVKATGGYGTIPALLAKDGSAGCCESNAIARTIARASKNRPMYGRTTWEQAQVDMFLDKCLVFERDVGPWIDFALFGESGGFHLDDRAVARLRDVALKWLRAVDGHLEGRGWLVGDDVTVADVALGCQLLVPWCAMLDDEIKSAVPHLAAHLAKLWAMPEFAADLGDAVKALTDEYASRRGNVERTR